MLKQCLLALLIILVTPVASAGWQEGYSSHVSLHDFEASGIVWDQYSGQLVTVDDGGDVYSSDGNQIKVGGDLEGIATTGNGFIYVGSEGTISTKPKITELYAPPYMSPTGRTWTLTDFPVPSSNNTGMEGLTWVPNGHHPYGNRSSGGVFYASSMSNGRVYVFDVNLTFSGTATTLLNPGGFVPLSGENSISDLYYDSNQRSLFVLYNNADRLVRVNISDASPTVTSILRLPIIPSHQEGVTFLPSCTASGSTTIYLSDDASGSGYYGFVGFPGVCAADPRKADTIAATVPLEVQFGARRVVTKSATVTIRNSGTTTWAGSTFSLVPLEGPFNGASLGASESIVPGQTKTFTVTGNFGIEGTIHVQWRMKQGDTWFGEPTPEYEITVIDNLGPCPTC